MLTMPRQPRVIHKGGTQVTSRVLVVALAVMLLTVPVATTVWVGHHLPHTRTMTTSARPRVIGRHLLTASGVPVALRGVSVDGSEYACQQGWAVTERPVDAALVSDLKSLGATMVRLPLNEDCWLGINSTSAYSGTVYQTWLQNAVDTLTAAGLTVDLDLHWTAPGTQAATKQANMPDADHSLTFWTQVATRFKDNPRVMFEAFNEPIGITNGDSDQNWRCLRDGGDACPGLGYQATGMQQLVDAIRATGAMQPIIVNGLGYAQIMTQYLAYLPHDPAHNLMAGVHMPVGWCPDEACWNREYAPVAAVMPLIATEIYDGGTLPVNPAGVIYQATRWLDAHGAGQVAWTDNTWGDAQTLRNGDASLSSWGWLWRAHTRASRGLAGNRIVDGWAGANSLYFGKPQLVPYAAHSGGHSEQLSAANDGVGQALGNLTPGQPVTATVWAVNKVAGQSVCIAVAGGTEAPVCATDTTYTQLTTTYTPTTTSATVLVYKSNGFDASWIDDLAVAAQPALGAVVTPSVLPLTATPPAMATDTPSPTATSTATRTNTPVPTVFATASPTTTVRVTPTATTVGTATPNPWVVVRALQTRVANLERRVVMVEARERAQATVVARVRGALGAWPTPAHN